MASACHDNPGTVATLPRPDPQLSPGCLNPSTHTRFTVAHASAAASAAATRPAAGIPAGRARSRPSAPLRAPPAAARATRCAVVPRRPAQRGRQEADGRGMSDAERERDLELRTRFERVTGPDGRSYVVEHTD